LEQTLLLLDLLAVERQTLLLLAYKLLLTLL
jgi:hypothetical protein